VRSFSSFEGYHTIICREFVFNIREVSAPEDLLVGSLTKMVEMLVDIKEVQVEHRVSVTRSKEVNAIADHLADSLTKAVTLVHTLVEEDILEEPQLVFATHTRRVSVIADLLANSAMKMLTEPTLMLTFPRHAVAAVLEEQLEFALLSKEENVTVEAVVDSVTEMLLLLMEVEDHLAADQVEDRPEFAVLSKEESVNAVMHADTVMT